MEELLLVLLQPLSELNIDMKTSLILAIIVFSTIYFNRQNKKTQKNVKEIKRIMQERLTDCEKHLEECRKGRDYVNQLFKNIRREFNSKCCELETDLKELKKKKK